MDKAEKLKYFESLLPKAANVSYDLGLVVRNLIVHMQAEGMTAEQAIATEDEVVKEGNIGGSANAQERLRQKWSDFKAQYLSVED